jgi:hypothetical protein
MIKLINILKEIKVQQPITFTSNQKLKSFLNNDPKELKKFFSELGKKLRTQEEIQPSLEPVIDIIGWHKFWKSELDPTQYNTQNPELVISDDDENDYIFSVEPLTDSYPHYFGDSKIQMQFYSRPIYISWL